MAEKQESVTIPELEAEVEKLSITDSGSEDGPLESESSDPDIDSSDAVCT